LSSIAEERMHLHRERRREIEHGAQSR
jgi:hypothetical protein